jgi:hypothetical protein
MIVTCSEKNVNVLGVIWTAAENVETVIVGQGQRGNVKAYCFAYAMRSNIGTLKISHMTSEIWK